MVMVLMTRRSLNARSASVSVPDPLYSWMAERSTRRALRNETLDMAKVQAAIATKLLHAVPRPACPYACIMSPEQCRRPAAPFAWAQRRRAAARTATLLGTAARAPARLQQPAGRATPLLGRLLRAARAPCSVGGR
jgi:hypothetical protein